MSRHKKPKPLTTEQVKAIQEGNVKFYGDPREMPPGYYDNPLLKLLRKGRKT